MLSTPLHRSRELPCNPDFWLAVQEELLPQIQALTPFSARADRTVVAGQSFGGLSSLYAALNWPQRFGCVLSQSGSYWWPHRGADQDGQLIEQLKAGEKSATGLRIVLEAGRREPLIFRTNQALYAQLQHPQHRVFWRQVDGGHDALCWRGGLTQGLMTSLAATHSLTPGRRFLSTGVCMEFSNPFDNPQGHSLFCKITTVSTVCGRRGAHCPLAGV